MNLNPIKSLPLSVALFCTMAFAPSVLARPDSLKSKIRHHFILAKYNWGSVLNTNDFVAGENANGTPIRTFQSFALGFGKQTVGQRDWEHIHNFPSFGVALYTAHFLGSKELGYPNAIYGFYHAPFHRWMRSALLYNIGFGLTYNWQPYDQYNNPFNVAIGSYRTVYINLGVQYEYQLSPHWMMSLGLEAVHFSNGGTQKPNKGLNLFSPYASLRYQIRPIPELVRKTNLPFDKKNEVYLSLGAGNKQEEYDTIRYPELNNTYQDLTFKMYSISAAYMRQYSPKSKAGAGIDLVYDEWLGSTITVDPNGNAQKKLSLKQSDRWAIGLYGSHEFCISRLSILTQLGYYIWRKDIEGKKPSLYQRAGLKYHFANNLFVGISIFAHNFSSADFIEWSAGYRIQWMGRKKT